MCGRDVRGRALDYERVDQALELANSEHRRLSTARRRRGVDERAQLAGAERDEFRSGDRAETSEARSRFESTTTDLAPSSGIW